MCKDTDLRWLLLLAAFLPLASGLALGQADAQAADPCGQLSDTAALRSCEDARYAKAQQQLQAVYQKLMGQMDAPGKMKLRLAELAWMNFRETNAAFEADAARGGTLAPLLRVTTQAQMTEIRAMELKKSIH